MRQSLLILVLATAACGPPRQPVPEPSGEGQGAVEAAAAKAADTTTSADDASGRPSPPRPRIAAASRILAEWRRSENRADCAPVGPTDVGGADADHRPAHFSGGWAVAFDQPGARSQYGVAGTGSALGAFDAEAAKLRAQWPYRRAPANLPNGALAAYGVEGAAPYPPGNPDGIGLHSLAYFIVPGQRCLYNVWSRLGRRHLETLIDGLVLIPTR